MRNLRQPFISSLLLGSLMLGMVGGAQAGPFAPAAGKAGSTAVSKDSASIVQWATGYQDYVPGANVDLTWQTPAKALGKAVGDSFDVVTLGDSGRITLKFDGYITNGPGADFAVFENSFSDTFLELGFVEVSSNGTDFFRFPAYSFTSKPVSGFGTIDPTNIDGLAGKYRQGFGTAFDLATLAGRPGLDVSQVQYVRVVDVLGNGTVFDNTPVAAGGPRAIYDPFPSSGSAGFDLDAVGVINFAPITVVPEPSAVLMTLVGVLVLGLRRRRAL